MEEELESVSEGQLVITEVTDLDSVTKTFDLIKKSTPHLVAALTGNYCSYRSERGKRAAEMADSNNTDVFLIETQRLLFYADHTPTLKVIHIDFSMGIILLCNELSNFIYCRLMILSQLILVM